MIISGEWDYERFSLFIFVIYDLLQHFFCSQEKGIFKPLQFINRWYPHSFGFLLQFA